MKRFFRSLLVAAGLFAAVMAPAKAQIPVTDVASLTQQIQQVVSWGQQYTGMVNQIRNQVTQIQELQNTFNSLNGSRGFQALLNGATDQAGRRLIPDDLSKLIDLYNGTLVPGYTALNSRITSLRSTLSGLPPGFFPTGSPMEAELNKALDALGTQRVLADESMKSIGARTTNTENLIATIASATDPKAMAELQARMTGEQIFAQNEANRVAVMKYQQELQRQEQERKSRDALAQSFSRPLGGGTFPTAFTR
jgi:type IV secretion system protein VirB5